MSVNLDEDDLDTVPMLTLRSNQNNDDNNIDDINDLEISNVIETKTKRGCFGSIRYAVQHEKSLWIVFLDYFLSSWSDRMWAFAVPILFVEVLSASNTNHQDDDVLLLPASIFALASRITCVFFGSAVGQWIDRTNRRRVVIILLTIQNFTVVISAILFGFIDTSKGWKNSGSFWRLLAVMSIFGATSALSSLGTTVAIKKDWVVVLTRGDASRLSVVNAIMRGIDLTCEICAPMVFGIVLASLGVHKALLMVAIWNAVSYIPELSLLLLVYKMAEPLLSVRLRQPLRDLDEIPENDEDHHPSMDESIEEDSKYKNFFQRIKIYVKQPVFLSSFSLALLYFTVLQPGYLLTAYLKSQKVDDVIIASFRAVSAVVGLVSTLLVPIILAKRLMSVEAAASISLYLQFIFLIPCAIAVFITDASPYIFMASVAASRFALYSFDLVEMQIMQSGVPEQHRGVVNATETSLTNLMTLLSYALGIVVPDPKNFGYLVLISIAAVAIAAVCSSKYWSNARRKIQRRMPMV